MNVIERAGWKVHWGVSQSAGLNVHLVDYHGNRVLWQGSLPYVTVDHQQDEIEIDGEPLGHHGPLWLPLGRESLQGEPSVTDFRIMKTPVLDYKFPPRSVFW